ncbi:MAG: hypothetical protein U1F68_03200 [Gammaproteobacteria bacterium]
MRSTANHGGAVNYEPNSFGGPVEDPRVKEPPRIVARRWDLTIIGSVMV